MKTRRAFIQPLLPFSAAISMLPLLIPVVTFISLALMKSFQSFEYIFHPRYKAITIGAARKFSKKTSASGLDPRGKSEV